MFSEVYKPSSLTEAWTVNMWLWIPNTVQIWSLLILAIKVQWLQKGFLNILLDCLSPGLADCCLLAGRCAGQSSCLRAQRRPSSARRRVCRRSWGAWGSRGREWGKESQSQVCRRVLLLDIIFQFCHCISVRQSDSTSVGRGMFHTRLKRCLGVKILQLCPCHLLDISLGLDLLLLSDFAQYQAKGDFKIAISGFGFSGGKGIEHWDPCISR